MALAFGESFREQATLKTPWSVLQKPINVLSTAFREQSTNMVFKLRISTYIPDKLGQTLDNDRILTKLNFTYVG